MPLQEFWNDEPDLLWTYRNSYMRKTEEEAKLQKEMMNTSAWLQGYYTYIAVISAFSKGVNYPNKPIELEDKPLNKLEKSKEVENKIKQQLLNAKIMLEQRSAKKG